MKAYLKNFFIHCVLIVLVISMIMLPVVNSSSAFATTGEPIHSHDGWTELTGSYANDYYHYRIDQSGQYYLPDNIDTLDASKKFLYVYGDVNVTICLNGNDVNTQSLGIDINSGATVTITNCDAEHKSEINCNGTLIKSYCKALTLENVKITGTANDNGKVKVESGSNLTLNNVSFDCVGYCICLEDANNIEISNSSFKTNFGLDAYGKPVTGGNIIFTDYNYSLGNIKITNSEFTNTYGSGIYISTSEHGNVELSNSTFNCASGINVKGGEVSVKDCKFIDVPDNSSGSAVWFEAVADKTNSVTVSGGECKTLLTGINIVSKNANVDLTLKGKIDFGDAVDREYGDLALFSRYDDPFKANVNLHLDELSTKNLVMYVPSEEYEGSINCDADYGAKLKAKDTKYSVFCEETADKNVVKFKERKITTQPTVENPKVEINDNSNVSYQWYKAEEKAYEVKDTASEGVLAPDECYGTYENGVWKPIDMGSGPMSLYGPSGPLLGLALEDEVLKGNCSVIIENKKGSLEEYKECFFVQENSDYNSFDVEAKEGKLYFSGKAAGLTIMAMGIPQDAELVIKVTLPKDTEKLQGQTSATLNEAQPGDYRCHVIWEAGTAYEYEILSDIVTLKQAMPGNPGQETAKTTSDPKTGDPTSVLPWVALMAVAGTGALALKRKKG